MRLLASDPKARSKPGSAPANFASPSAAEAASLSRKRTRDLPNLFDCHCCGRRINRDNPRDRPQALDSLWRIVLLCEKCRKSVQSGETCSYCFRETGNSEDLCKCSVCRRKIHKDCVRGYGDCSPWCYLGVELEEFRVCVDCWIPDLLKNSTSVCRSTNKVMLKNRAEGKRLLVNNKKRENEAMNRRKLMENVVDLENGESDSLGKKDESLNSAATEVADLVNQSHGNISHLTNSGSLDALDALNSLGNEKSSLGKDGSTGEKIDAHIDDKDNGRMERLGSDRRKSFGRFDRGLLGYQRTRFRRKACQDQEHDSHGISDGSSDVNGRCNDVNGIHVGFLSCKQGREQKKLLLYDENDVASEDSHEMNNADVSEGSCNVGMVYDKFGQNLVYNRDKWRKKCQISEGNIVVFDRFGHGTLFYKRSRFKKRACEINGMADVNGVNNVDGLSQEVLTYKREQNRKRWQLYGGALVSDI